MDRRAFLAALGAGIAATPLVGQAQQAGKVWRIAVLTVNPRPAPEVPHHYNSFVEGLRDLGYREGENVIIEWRSFQGLPERRAVEVAALMQWKPDVFVVPGGPDARYVRDATTDVPIVVQNTGDMVLGGLAGC
jgi:putative ABC transport system substrate-binding protein